MDPRVLVCAQRGQSRILQAKQRRSFRVPPINHPQACGPKAVKATFCSKTGPFFSCDSNKILPQLDLVEGARILGSENGPSSARVCPRRSGPHSAAKRRRSFRVPPINHPQARGPKAVKATFCSKTGPFFSCDSNKFCPNSIQ